MLVLIADIAIKVPKKYDPLSPRKTDALGKLNIRNVVTIKIPKSISLVMVDVETGLAPNGRTKNIIFESFKPGNNFIVGLENQSNKDKLGLHDSTDERTILRFY